MTCGAMAGVDYSSIDLRAIEDCLMSTGVFDSVRLYPEGDLLIIEVAETDSRPGRVEGTISYVAQDGLTAELSFEQYNLFPSTYGALHLMYNTEVRSFDANLYRTDIRGEGLDLGLDLIARESDYDDQSYSHRSIRFEPYLAWMPDDDLRLEAGLGLRQQRMGNVDANASALVRQEAKDSQNTAPYLRFSLDFTSSTGLEGERADWARPGYSIALDQFFWNLGGSDPLSDTRFELQAQLPISETLRLQSGVRGGMVSGLSGNATRSIDRFFPGADTFRGFAPRGVGPRDSGDALGGNKFLVSYVELQRDFGEIFGSGMRGGIFFETGAAWGLDDTLNGQINDGWQNRSSIGLSLTFEVGETPVALYVAEPLRKQPGDEVQVFGLGFTARF
nr:BamA/TamA family outer membrane protein [Oceaniglobus trochenteri]